MTTTRRFYLGFAAAALLIAGIISYFASSHPDGLDSATLRGCETAADDSLTGSCIAQSATDHSMTGSPLADYTIFGNDSLTGVAGIAGAVATFVLAGGVFWLIARSRRRD
jgi:cobalt/nickel transport protein